MTDKLDLYKPDNHTEIDSTTTQYNSSIKRYIESGRYLPTTSYEILNYIQEEGSINKADRLKASTLRAHRSALKRWHLDGGWEDPTKSREIELALKRLASLERQNGISKDASRYITPEECLQLILTLLNLNNTEKELRDRLICCLFLVSGHRAGMLARIKVTELMNLNIEGAHIIIDTPAFKTEEEAPTLIPFTGTEFCPATWLRTYISETKVTTGYIFKGSQQDFGKPLTRQTLNTIVKNTLSRAGITSGKLTSHSFRKSMATIAAMEGINSKEIASQGSWSGTETVDKDYINNAVGLLGRAPIAVIQAISRIHDASSQHKLPAIPSSESLQIMIEGKLFNVNKTEARFIFEQLKTFLEE